MPLLWLDGPTILPGESLSDGLDVTAGDPVRITMPAHWTPAILTFQVSTDGDKYNDAFDNNGKECQINVVPGAAHIIPFDWRACIGFLRLRSGTRDKPVVQPDQRRFAVTLQTLA